MICPHCAHENDTGMLYCRECRYLFLGEPIQGPIPEENERILQLALGCETLYNGECDLPYFREWLRDFTADQERREQEIVIVFASVPVGLEEDFQEEVDIGFQGVKACKEALANLAQYDPTFSPWSSMTQELYLFYKGTWAVKEAMRINRRNRDRPLWF